MTQDFTYNIYKTVYGFYEVNLYPILFHTLCLGKYFSGLFSIYVSEYLTTPSITEKRAIAEIIKMIFL